MKSHVKHHPLMEDGINGVKKEEYSMQISVCTIINYFVALKSILFVNININ
jgi:hypothetical protein